MNDKKDNIQHNNYFDDLNNLIINNEDANFITKLKIYYNNGFDINHLNEYGNTLLHIACRKRNYNIVEHLINKYNANTNIKNNDGRNPLHLSTIYGSTQLSYYLLENGSSKSSVNKSNINNSSKIIAKLIKSNNNLLLDEDNMKTNPLQYYLIHSDIKTNLAILQAYPNYIIKQKFFKLMKENNSEEYESNFSIFMILKKLIN